MLPWNQSSAYNLLQSDGCVLETAGQKRRRSSTMATSQALTDATRGMYDERMYDVRLSDDSSVELCAVELSPLTGGHNFCDLDSQSDFQNDKWPDFYSSTMDEIPSRASEGEHLGRMSNEAFDHASARYRNHHRGRSLESAVAATAQAIANFQAQMAGLQAENSANDAQGASSFRHAPDLHAWMHTPSFAAGGQTNHGFRAPRFGSTATSTGNQNRLENTPFGDAHMRSEIYSSETRWPNLTCHTAVRNGNQSMLDATTGVSGDIAKRPQSPCTPRGNQQAHSVLSDAHQEYLQHMQRINSQAAPETPRHNSRGRRLSYIAPREFRNFDESDFSQPLECSAHAAATEVDESTVSETTGIYVEPPGMPAELIDAGDRFDLNEVPGAGGETPKAKKKYHPRVAKDKRIYKRRVDGKKVPAPVDRTNTNFTTKKTGKRLYQTQYDLANEEGRHSRHPEVVDMDIEESGVEDTGRDQFDREVDGNLLRAHDSSSSVCLNLFAPESGAPAAAPAATAAGDQFDQGNRDARRLLECFESNDLQLSASSVPPRESAYATVRSVFAPPAATTASSFQPQGNQSAFARSLQDVVAHHRDNMLAMNRHNLLYLQMHSGSVGEAGGAIVPRASDSVLEWNPRLEPHNRTATNNYFVNWLYPSGILYPQRIPYQMMNKNQRVAYLKSVLRSSHHGEMPLEAFLCHVNEHLPEIEMQQLVENAQTDQVTEAPDLQIVEYEIDKTKPKSKSKKPSRKELQLSQSGWPELMSMREELATNSSKAGRGEKGKKTSNAERQEQQNSDGSAITSQPGLEMVPYEKKTMIPYDGPFLPLRKRKPRPKVVLDNETIRVWKLLMGKTASTETETDVENELKWEEERHKMKAQAQVFIDRMHIVQGDRSFSCWKGSVVDSVVGAFLTQNVNDVLSSSAFMSMRSRFPGRGFRRPLQSKAPEEETVAQSFESELGHSSSPPAPPPTLQESPYNSGVHEASSCKTPSPQEVAQSTSECRPASVLESQESRNEESYDHLRRAESTQNLAGVFSRQLELERGIQLEGAATITISVSSEMNQENITPHESQSDEQSQTAAKTSTYSLSDHTSILIDLQMVAITENTTTEESSGANNDHHLDIVSAENETIRTLSRSENELGSELVDASHQQSHSKYNRKTGLTGLERARLEEKQVTARKSFDFTKLQEDFKPRITGQERPTPLPRSEATEDGVDWEAVRNADVQEVADVIKERGLNWILAGRIKAFLERLHLDYGAIDLEWLRSMSTDQTKEFLLSIRGLGLKSVECVRLLTLHHLAFPVDTNVGRICVRLGWVPLEPLPEELQLHLLELYPVQATIQKYLWPRLCKLDQTTLYELHYQMITFGKVFCTKSKPNCNACPMRPECKHFASALSSAKLAILPPETANNDPTLALPAPVVDPESNHRQSATPVSQYCQPIVEEPMTPESEADMEDFDIEDFPFSVEEVEDATDMSICIQEAAVTLIVQQGCNQSTISPNCRCTSTDASNMSLSELAELQKQDETTMEDWRGLATSASDSQLGINSDQDSCPKVVENEDLDEESNNPSVTEVLVRKAASHEMVLLPPGAASLPVPKLKNVGRLRTIHYVYELPDNHPLLEGLDRREDDDPCTYLLAIWSPGEVPESIPNIYDNVNEENPFESSNFEGEESIKATLLVPCRTAMQGSFPLNGTYFQVNEVFADHASSLQPILVPRTLLWNLRRRFVFFGTSVTSIFRGMTVEEIQACFWRGYVCVRGFDRLIRAPKPLVGRLHLQAGKSSGRGADI